MATTGTGFDVPIALNLQRRQDKMEDERNKKWEAHENTIKDLIDQRSAIVAKLPNLLDETGKPTQAYNDAFDSLKKINSGLIEAYDPTKHEGAIQKLGHLLTDHLGIKVNGETLPERRQDKSDALAAKKDDLATTQTNQQIAAAPLSPAQEDNAAAASQLRKMQGTIKNIKTLFPNQPPEVVNRWQNELAQQMMGVKPIAEKYFTQLATTEETLPDGTKKEHYWRVPMDPVEQPEEVDFNGQKMVPKASAQKTPKGLKYDPLTGEVVNADTGERTSISDIAAGKASPEAIKMFNDAKVTMDEKQKKALQLATTRMEALGASRIVTPINPANPAQEIYATAGEAAKKHMLAPGSIEYKMALPTASERQRADFALSAHEQLETMKSILANRPDLFGPLSGRYTDFTQWVGSQDPDAQRFRIAAQITSDHAIAVFGARSQYASESIFNVVGQNATNPAAGAAALDQLDKALKTIGGRGLGPIAPGAGTTLNGSTQGGGSKGRRSLAAAMALPINKGKSEAEVSKHLSDLGYTVVRP